MTTGVRSAGRPERVRLGDVLIAQKAISQEQLRLGLEEQKRSGRKLGRALIDLGFVSEERIGQALARQLNVAFVNLKMYNFNRAIVLKLPEAAARRFRALALEDRGAAMLVSNHARTSAMPEVGRSARFVEPLPTVYVSARS